MLTRRVPQIIRQLRIIVVDSISRSDLDSLGVADLLLPLCWMFSAKCAYQGRALEACLNGENEHHAGISALEIGKRTSDFCWVLVPIELGAPTVHYGITQAGQYRPNMKYSEKVQQILQSQESST